MAILNIFYLVVSPYSIRFRIFIFNNILNVVVKKDRINNNFPKSKFFRMKKPILCRVFQLWKFHLRKWSTLPTHSQLIRLSTAGQTIVKCILTSDPLKKESLRCWKICFKYIYFFAQNASLIANSCLFPTNPFSFATVFFICH